ncbi:hypothetical protein QCD70_15495 [Agreia sp. PsM10]|uniref:CBU_0592 family membrane protein n=1 Tax=Agreia sp. PsM10 TaxID=3030533 RepID=UPI00263B8994|nr:hypothetical protein [Agreia sp. PsM10]MDN4641656.1 hypothetical protein [Agreia sp. PsM10]
MNIPEIANIVGIVGVSIVVVTYFLLQISVLKVSDLSYSSLNATASVLVLFSLAFHWNLSSAIIEIFWLAISIYGCIAWLRQRIKASHTDVADPEGVTDAAR